MWLVLVMLTAILWFDPNAQSIADTVLGQTENLISAQFSTFFAAAALALLASGISWFMTNMPRRTQRAQFRVVKRYYVQQ